MPRPIHICEKTELKSRWTVPLNPLGNMLEILWRSSEHHIKGLVGQLENAQKVLGTPKERQKGYT